MLGQDLSAQVHARGEDALMALTEIPQGCSSKFPTW